MPYERLEVNELVKTMSKAGSTTNNWDVLCSYDLQALNRVLLKEYQKIPVNSQLNFFTNETISSKIHEKLDCNLKFDNPTLSFSSIQSGIYSLKIPISYNSYCNKTIFYKGNIDENTTITIPHGYNILASGPLKTIKGVGRNKVISSSDEIVEFGNSNQANVVLHFGKDLRQVEISKDSNIQSKQDLEDLLTEIKNNFANNIKQVDYNIVQVVSETAKLGDIVLTPKSFIITTMADQSNPSNGVLNIWIQTNESNNPQGNPQPSFYPIGTTILPIPNNHDSSIIFSKQLMANLYFKRSLEKDFNISFTNIEPYSNSFFNGGIGIKLIPIKQDLIKQDLCFKTLYVGKIITEDYSINCNALIINYANVPFWLFSDQAGQLNLKWEWEQEFSCESLLARAYYTVGGMTSELNKGAFQLKSNIYQPIHLSGNNYIIKNNILNITELKINSTKLDSDSVEWWTFFTTTLRTTNVDFPAVENNIKESIRNHISHIKINFGSLNYFAEANILFNEERFKITNDEAIYFPGDTIIFGDIEEKPDAHQIRHKRHHHYDKKLNTNAHAIDHISTESSEFISSSASSVASPINTVINWLSNSFAQLKFLSSANIITNYGFIKDGIQNIQSIFATSEHISSDNIKNDDTVTSINIGQFDVNASLTLANFVIRYFAKVKPYNIKEEPIDLLGVKAYVLNIITRFEEILNDPSIQSYLPVETLEFDPVVLMSKLEKAVINGDYTKIGKILHRSIINNNITLDDTQFSSYIQDKINEMLAQQQNTEYSYNQQLITDYTSNNHTTVEDMSNILSIENDVDYTNHQSEVNLIG